MSITMLSGISLCLALIGRLKCPPKHRIICNYPFRKNIVSPFYAESSWNNIHQAFCPAHAGALEQMQSSGFLAKPFLSGLFSISLQI